MRNHLVNAWAFVTVFDMAGSVYNYGGFEGGQMDRVQFTSVMAEVYSKSFCFGIVCTGLGHHLANAKTKEKKRRLPFVHPSVLDAFPLNFLPRGQSATITVFMGVFWACVMGSALAALVLLLWFLMGMNHEKHAMPGAWYALYSAASAGLFAPALMAVGLLQGATDMPAVVMAAFNRQAGRTGAPADGRKARVLALCTRQTITIVQTPRALWRSFTSLNRTFFFFLVFALTAIGTAFTYAYLYKKQNHSLEEASMYRLEGRDELIKDFAISTLFVCLCTCVSCTWYKAEVRNGAIAYLDPKLFETGIWRIVPYDFDAPYKTAKRCANNCAWWVFFAEAFTVAMSYILEWEIAFSGRAYVQLKVGYYVVLITLCAGMNVCQICADIPDGDFRDLQRARAGDDGSGGPSPARPGREAEYLEEPTLAGAAARCAGGQGDYEQGDYDAGGGAPARMLDGMELPPAPVQDPDAVVEGLVPRTPEEKAALENARAAEETMLANAASAAAADDDDDDDDARDEWPDVETGDLDIIDLSYV